MIKLHKQPRLNLFHNCQAIKASTYVASLDSAVQLAKDKENVTLLLGLPDSDTNLIKQWLAYAKLLKATLKKDKASSTSSLFGDGRLVLRFPEGVPNHTKVYLLDNHSILFGSANLTRTAFSKNQIEGLIQLDKDSYPFSELKAWLSEMFKESQAFPFEGFNEKAKLLDSDTLADFLDYKIQEFVRSQAEATGKRVGEYVEIDPSISQNVPKAIKEQLGLQPRKIKGGTRMVMKANTLKKNERPLLEVRNGEIIYNEEPYFSSDTTNLAADLSNIKMFLDGFSHYLLATDQDKNEMMTIGWEVLLWFLASPLAYKLQKYSKSFLKENFPHLLITGVPASGKTFLSSLGNHLLIPRSWDSFDTSTYTNLTYAQLRGICNAEDNVYPIVNDEADLTKDRQNMDAYLKEEHWNSKEIMPALCFVSNKPAQYFPPELQRRSILYDCGHSFNKDQKTDQLAYLRGIIHDWYPTLGRYVAHQMSNMLDCAEDSNQAMNDLFGASGDLLHLPRAILTRCFYQYGVSIPKEFPTKHLNTWQLISSSHWRNLYYSAPERFNHHDSRIHYDWADNSEYHNMGKLLPRHVYISKGQRQGVVLDKQAFLKFLGISDGSASLLSRISQKLKKAR